MDLLKAAMEHASKNGDAMKKPLVLLLSAIFMREGTPCSDAVKRAATLYDEYDNIVT